MSIDIGMERKPSAPWGALCQEERKEAGAVMWIALPFLLIATARYDLDLATLRILRFVFVKTLVG